MRVLVTGATGFIGSRLCSQLGKRGDEVLVLSRGASGGGVFHWAPLTEIAPPEAFDRCDAIVHLAGESISGRWTMERKRLIHDSRVLGTRNLVSSLSTRSVRPRVLVAASAVGYYGNDRGEEVLPEHSSSGEGFLAEVCRNWEAEAQKAETLGMRVVRVRIGMVLDAGGGALQPLAATFRRGLGGRLGTGRQFMSWIHRDDLVGLILHVLDHGEVTGVLNATAPNPVRNADFTRALAAVLGCSALLPAPAFALRLILGEFAEVLLGSLRVVPQVAIETGYQFRYPEIDTALWAALT